MVVVSLGFSDARYPRLAGELFEDEQHLRWAAEDWGHLVHDRPRAVLRPGSVSDIRAMARFAAERGIPFVPRAQGHSSGGQAQAKNGIVVDMRGLNGIDAVQSEHVVVGAGARWSEVLRATLSHGLTPPVLTDYLELSVGGTLSVGGIGGTSHRSGLQTDNVAELEIVTEEDELRTCSRTRDSDLFDAVLGGRGRHGTIIRATLRLIPAKTCTRRYKLYYRELSPLLADQCLLVEDGRFDHIEGHARFADSGEWIYAMVLATHFDPGEEPDDAALLGRLGHESAEIDDMGCFDFLNQMEDDEAYLRSTGAWEQPHPWLDLMLPGSAAEDFIVETMRKLVLDDIGESGLVLFYPFHTRVITTPRVRVPAEPRAFLFSLLRTAPHDEVVVSRLVESNRELRQRALSLGGTVYLEHAESP
ncbi:FAD/FMN-containing dehydrogenase [Saccharopolyspora erythraea NRRL 2338]|uniref:FAD-binding PCMH-type domain-containing protein n=2 Tax=Saccharopolyspora erythraea TaxID=1836 RepID=A0ABN1E4F2_SACER|nr:FAD-binding protein [Saccharopolyspora erythraea D]PFG99439.1 FAD/FMN-containing dehydrogenase [Saccharopolyspora erythraea NRRL 2338]